LHIGLERVNLMQLQPGTPRPVVRAAASISHGTSRDELIADPARLKALFKRAFAEQPFRGKRVVTCLPNDQIKILLLSYTMSEGTPEADAVIRELRERVDEELDGMVVDYIPVRQEHPSRPREAIVAMAARDKVTAYLDALTHAGLEVASLDIAPAALARLLSWIGSEDVAAHPNLLLINFGARSSYLTVVWGRRLMLDRPIEFAEQRLLARLKNILDMPEAAAKRLLLERGFGTSAAHDANEVTNMLKDVLRPEFVALKHEVNQTLLQETGAERGSEISDTLKEVLRPEFATLKAEVDNTLVYAASRAHGRTVDRIYVVGSIARYPGIEHLLREQFSLPLEILDPFSIFSHRLSEKELSWLWPRSGVAAATGLALRGVPVQWPT
jgi:type IV pilus assembly protein PilM